MALSVLRKMTPVVVLALVFACVGAVAGDTAGSAASTTAAAVGPVNAATNARASGGDAVPQTQAASEPESESHGSGVEDQTAIIVESEEMGQNPEAQTILLQHQYNILYVKVLPIVMLVIFLLILLNMLKKSGVHTKIIRTLRMKITRTRTRHILPVHHAIRTTTPILPIFAPHPCAIQTTAYKPLSQHRGFHLSFPVTPDAPSTMYMGSAPMPMSPTPTAHAPQQNPLQQMCTELDGLLGRNNSMFAAGQPPRIVVKTNIARV